MTRTSSSGTPEPTPADVSPLLAFTSLWQETLHWTPSTLQQQQFAALYQGVIRGNQQMNLTRLTTPSDFWEKHLWDSLSGVWPWLCPTHAQPTWRPTHAITRVIDIGTGAGFPGLPVAIACPDWQVTLLDATRKKIHFLQELAQALGLETVNAIAERAESLAHHPSHRGHYDLALVRAVGAPATCAEYALPLLRTGGVAVLYRGQWTTPEAETLATVAQRLGGQMQAVHPWQTPLTQGQRHCIYLHKQHPTPDTYPRAVGLPAKVPLSERDEATRAGTQ